MTVSGQVSCPPAGSFMAASGQFLVAAVTCHLATSGDLSLAIDMGAYFRWLILDRVAGPGRRPVFAWCPHRGPPAPGPQPDLT